MMNEVKKKKEVVRKIREKKINNEVIAHWPSG